MTFLKNLAPSQILVLIFILIIFFLATFKLFLDAYIATKKALKERSLKRKFSEKRNNFR